MDEARKQVLRGLPSVEELASDSVAEPLLQQYPRAQVVEAVRAALETTRARLLRGEGADLAGDLATDLSPETLLAKAGALLRAWDTPGLRPVLNLTGVVVHTNLGRSALAAEAVERVAAVARGYSNLEYDLEQGERGRREDHVETLLVRLTGAEAAFVVNNNAGAVLLLLMGLAGGREVLVSRGQLVEIGGAFRLPDIMKAGGVRLVEVGTTNRTRAKDYEKAITEDTALILRVHTSNYRIVGFTKEVGLSEMVELGRRRGIPVADDIGSGALHEWEGFHGEPSVAQSLDTGADVVCFSGDKLLGGPQAGVLVGRGEAIEKLRDHPVARALRADKMTLAALEATLELHQDPQKARTRIPTLRYLKRDPAESAALAAALEQAIERRSAGGFILEVEETSARAGGGSMPLVELPSHAVRIRLPEPPVQAGSPGGKAQPAGAAGGPGGLAAVEAGTERPGAPTVSALDAALRRAPSPVVGRISQDSLHLDVIGLEESDVEAVAENVAWALERITGTGADAQTATDAGVEGEAGR